MGPSLGSYFCMIDVDPLAHAHHSRAFLSAFEEKGQKPLRRACVRAEIHPDLLIGMSLRVGA